VQIEVRCCCQPQKLLGWLPVPDGVKPGQMIKFTVTPARWVLESFESEPAHLPADVIALPVATFSYGFDHRSLALKSEETPLERLRLIPGFVEAPDARKA